MPDDRRSAMPTEAPFMSSSPAPWAMRGLSTLVIALFAAALLGCLFVKVPETVTSGFELVPVQGSDPLRATRSGTIVSVDVLEGQAVRAGEPLFRLRSEALGDRASERKTASAVRRGAIESLANEREADERQRQGDAEQGERLEALAREIAQQLELRRGSLSITADVLARQRSLLEQGLLSQTEFSKLELEAREARIAVEELEARFADANGEQSRHRNEMQARSMRHREEVRRLEQQIETSDIRIATLQEMSEADAAGHVTVTAPCKGSILRLRVMSAGSFVREGEALAEIACAEEPLRAMLTIPQSHVALVETGQQVKLLYEAFPHSRYGVRFGVVSSVSPAGVQTEEGRLFRALATISDDSISVRGKARPLLAGMGGRAKIIVGHRSVASFAIEPLRQLREAVRSRPPESAVAVAAAAES